MPQAVHKVVAMRDRHILERKAAQPQPAYGHVAFIHLCQLPVSQACSEELHLQSRAASQPSDGERRGFALAGSVAWTCQFSIPNLSGTRSGTLSRVRPSGTCSKRMDLLGSRTCGTSGPGPRSGQVSGPCNTACGGPSACASSQLHTRALQVVRDQCCGHPFSISFLTRLRCSACLKQSSVASMALAVPLLQFRVHRCAMH